MAFVSCTTLNLWSAETPASIAASSTAEVKVVSNIAYKSRPGLSDDDRAHCKLDLYLPLGRKGFATLVWFHGGGLENGDKKDVEGVARSLAQAGIAVVCANYRLSPKAKYPSYVEDAAAAVAWTHAHIAEDGGDASKLFVGGHSAGGWLALMVGLDGRYLKADEMDAAALAGIISVSGQTMTHYTVRKERGIGKFTITADEAAPVYYARKDTPPVLMLYADHDMAARAEEGAYFVAVMKGAGNEWVNGQLIPDRDHNSIAARIVNPDDPARLAILKFMKAGAAP
jgi:acetyl esterase/lipase